MKRIIFISLIILLTYPIMVSAAGLEKMKIAVAASNKTAKASVSNMAAKCPYYLFFNDKGEMVEVIDNPYKDAIRGAGTSAANFLIQKDVDIIVAGSFGSKMIDALRSNGKIYFEFKGNVDDAVKKALEIN